MKISGAWDNSIKTDEELARLVYQLEQNLPRADELNLRYQNLPPNDSEQIFKALEKNKTVTRGC